MTISTNFNIHTTNGGSSYFRRFSSRDNIPANLVLAAPTNSWDWGGPRSLTKIFFPYHEREECPEGASDEEYVNICSSFLRFSYVFSVDGREGRTTFHLKVEDGMCYMEKVSGYDPETILVLQTLERVLDGFCSTYYNRPIQIGYRSHRAFRIAKREGMSGCQDYHIEENHSGVVKRRFILHNSCNDKCAGFSARLSDLLELMSALQICQLDREGIYKEMDTLCGMHNIYLVGCDEHPYHGVLLNIFSTRDIEEESGWVTAPNHDPIVVDIKKDICREYRLPKFVNLYSIRIHEDALSIFEKDGQWYEGQKALCCHEEQGGYSEEWIDDPDPTPVGEDYAKSKLA